MIKTLRQLLLLYLFWLLFFAAFRILFLIFNAKYFHGSEAIDLFKIFIYALRLDISAASYLVIIPALFLLFNQFYHHAITGKIFAVFHYIILPVVVLAMLGNIIIYNYWGAMLSKRALQFLNDPAEVLASVTWFQLIAGIAVYILLCALFIMLFRKLRLNSLPKVKDHLIKKIITAPLFTFIVAFALRGGFQLIPVNESSCYFSNKTSENHASINALWFLIRNMLLSERAGAQQFVFFDEKISEQIFNEMMHADADTSFQFLTTSTPNIVFIIGESHTADVVEALGGEKGNSPHLDSLINESLVFTQCYASGSRTDQGIVSIFSGFPAQPNNSIIRHDEKTDKLPYITKPLIAKGYNTSFFYGGELGFANMKSYLLHAGFQKLSDKSDYSGNKMNSKWGAHDAYVLQKQFDYINKASQPFLSAVLTLSLHEPFEIPIANHFEGNSTEINFKNAAYYTDQCLGDYFAMIKKQPWYANTLFIFLADHGHHYPRNTDYYSIESHRIPLVFFGGALKQEYRGRKIESITAQHDLAQILAAQLKLQSEKFDFSKNTLNKNTNHFAYLCYDDGFTLVTNDCSVNYLTSTKSNKTVSGNCDSLKTETVSQKGKAYLQEVYKRFLGY